MPRILVDGDACPVKDEIYRVAARRRTPVTLVSNSYLRTPPEAPVELVVVGDGFDAAAEHGRRDEDLRLRGRQSADVLPFAGERLTRHTRHQRAPRDSCPGTSTLRDTAADTPRHR